MGISCIRPLCVADKKRCKYFANETHKTINIKEMQKFTLLKMMIKVLATNWRAFNHDSRVLQARKLNMIVK